MNNLFSIVTVVFNDEKVIEETLRSINNQLYENIEFIIVDGGSKDGTLNIIKKYRFNILISEEDNGIFDAMNKGIQNASGEYIIFMNAGDSFFSKNTLKDINNTLGDSSPDFIYGDSIEFDKNKSFYKKARRHSTIWYGMFAHHQAMLYKKSVIDINNISYNLDYMKAGDYAFTATFLSFANSVLYFPKPVCKYLLGGLSFTNFSNDFSELKLIKKEILGLSTIKIFLITSLQKLLNMLRKKATPFYNLIRYGHF